jgi:hypothetical protein
MDNFSLRTTTMPRFQRTDRVPSSLDATGDHSHSDAEFLPDFQDYMPSFSHGHGTTMLNQHTSTEPVLAVPPKRARARSPIPTSHARSRPPFGARRNPSPEWRIGHVADSGLASELVTRRADTPFQATAYAIKISRPIACSSRSATCGGTPAQPNSDSELYADSDGEFEELASSLTLAIETNVDEMEKWELPPRT